MGSGPSMQASWLWCFSPNRDVAAASLCVHLRMRTRILATFTQRLAIYTQKTKKQTNKHTYIHTYVHTYRHAHNTCVPSCIYTHTKLPGEALVRLSLSLLHPLDAFTFRGKYTCGAPGLGFGALGPRVQGLGFRLQGLGIVSEAFKPEP